MSYTTIRSEIQENHELVKRFDAEIKNDQIPDYELSRIFGEIMRTAMLSSNYNFRSNNLAANLMAYAYTSILDSTQKSSFQTTTGLS